MLSVANVRTAGGAANYFAADNYENGGAKLVHVSGGMVLLRAA